jgi:hypothetical protein
MLHVDYRTRFARKWREFYCRFASEHL